MKRRTKRNARRSFNRAYGECAEAVKRASRHERGSASHAREMRDALAYFRRALAAHERCL